MGWANNQTNAHLALTAGIFVAAGTIILYIINGILAFRFGETIRILVLSRGLLFGIILTLILLIVAAVQSAYTLNSNIRSIDRKLQLYGTTFYAIIAGLPLLVLLISHITANRPPSTSKLGPSRHRRRVVIVVLVSAVLSLRAIWICAVTWQTPTSLTQPLNWYLNKPAFYLVSLLPELIAVFAFCVLRIDNYFWTGPDGTFDDPSSTLSSPEPLVTPLPPPLNPNREPKIAWTPPPIRSDVEQGFGMPQRDYNTQGGIGPRQRYPPGVKMMSPVDEENMYAAHKTVGMSVHPSHESLSGQSYQYAATVTGDDNMDYPMPPKFSNRVSQGTLSIVSTFPDPQVGGNGGYGHGRTSLAMDPSTGLYHFVSAPLVPMFSPTAMGMGQDPHQSSYFGESPFADPPMFFNNSNRQSRMSNAPTLFSTATGNQPQAFQAFPFPSQHMQFQGAHPMQFQAAPMQYPTPPPPAVLTANNTGSSSSSSSSGTIAALDQNTSSSSSTQQAGTAIPFSNNPPPPPPPLPIVTRKASPLSMHPPQGNHPNAGNPPLFRPGSIYQRRRTSSLLSQSRGIDNNNNNNANSPPSTRMSRLINNPQPPTLAALRIAEGKQRATSSSHHMSMASVQSTGLESLVNMVHGASVRSNERAEQQRQQSQRERPGFPGSGENSRSRSRSFENGRTGVERPNHGAGNGNGNGNGGISAASKHFWGEAPAMKREQQQQQQVSPMEASHRR